MAATVEVGLKPPPRFVTNPWAWSYTLNKLEAKRQLDLHGNPKNYGAAVAIYKAVVKKYGHRVGEAIEVTRADLIGLDTCIWVVSHGAAWTATEQATARIYHNHARWWLERYGDEGQTFAPLEPETVSWLLRHVDGAAGWVAEH